MNVFGTVVINLLDKCNLECDYCFRDSGPKKKNILDFGAVKKILDFFWSKNKAFGVNPIVQFTGGEIFLHKDIFKIIEYALSLGFIVRLQTNGTLLGKIRIDRVRILSHDNVILKVSLDGWDEYTHGAYRDPTTFNPVIRGIKNIRAITPKIGLKTVVHEKNFPELNRMLDLCMELSIKSWAHNVFREDGRCAEKGAITEFDVVGKLIPYYSQPQYKHLLGGSNVLIYYLMNRQGIKTLPLYFFVNSDGGVYLTDKVLSSNRTGSVFGNNLEKEFDIANVSNIPRQCIPDNILRFVRNNLRI